LFLAVERNQAQEVEGKRSLSICRLRPDVVLHGEPYPDDKEIMEAVEDKLRACPGLVLE
jgi:NAD-dependent SIR2 family protein deacetylase